jgi:hypothetical protein
MATRNLNRPSYVLALLLGFVALVDAGNGLINMQMPDLCNYFYGGSGSTCNVNAGWLVDLGAAVVSAALVALLLLRPHFYVLAATFGWSALAFLTNLAMRHSAVGPDMIATYRMTVHLVVATIAAVLVVVEVLQIQAEKEATAKARMAALALAPAAAPVPALSAAPTLAPAPAPGEPTPPAAPAAPAPAAPAQ